jgi:predicted dehydrogenase
MPIWRAVAKMVDYPGFLVIGCGSIGRRHIANLQTLGVKKISAFDLQSDRRSEIEAEFNISTADSLEEAWSGRPEVACITAPTSMHVPLALEAASHGCHLLIEKPLGDGFDGVQQLLTAVDEQNLTTLVGCNIRFHHGPATIKKLLDNRAVGRIVSAHLDGGQYLPDWHPNEDYRQMYAANASMGGGVVLDGIHEIDYARWLFGEVAEVYSQGGKVSSLEIDTEDTVNILMKMTSGFSVSIHMDYIQRISSRTCKIIGEEGTIFWDISQGAVTLFTAGQKTWQSFPEPEGYNINQMYLDEMQHFLNCLAGQEKSTLDVYEAKRVLEIALAIKDSMLSGDPKKVPA